MESRSKPERLTCLRHISAQPMPAESLQTARELLAKLIARAYREDHPEAFRRRMPLHTPDGDAADEIEPLDDNH